jgi:hypothetical protein
MVCRRALRAVQSDHPSIYPRKFQQFMLLLVQSYLKKSTQVNNYIT